jgi:hypothetical protein
LSSSSKAARALRSSCEGDIDAIRPDNVFKKVGKLMVWPVPGGKKRETVDEDES